MSRLIYQAISIRDKSKPNSDFLFEMTSCFKKKISNSFYILLAHEFFRTKQYCFWRKGKCFTFVSQGRNRKQRINFDWISCHVVFPTPKVQRPNTSVTFSSCFEAVSFIFLSEKIMLSLARKMLKINISQSTYTKCA